MSALFVDLVASLPHYRAHLQPIWDALPDHAKGEIRTGSDAGHTPPRNRVCLVASWRDMHPLQGMTKFVYVEHGAGQSYGGDEKSAHWPDYSASRGNRHRDVVAYICPSTRVAKLWEHPNAFAVGSPRLDEFFRRPIPVMPRSVCLNFHWPCKIAPEAGTAFWHYFKALPAVIEKWKADGWDVWSHIHPKWEGEITAFLADAGAEPLHDNWLALGCAVMVSDNSSTMYEAASLGRRVVALNCPEYRRNINHGLRFWDAVPGIQVDEPAQLAAALTLIEHSQIHSMLAERGANAAYAFRDDRCAQRAADAIMTVID